MTDQHPTTPATDRAQIERELAKALRRTHQNARKFGGSSGAHMDLPTLNRLRRRLAEVDGRPPLWVEGHLGPLLGKFWLAREGGVEQVYVSEPHPPHLTCWRFGDYEATATFSRLGYLPSERKRRRHQANTFPAPVGDDEFVTIPVPPPFGGFEFFTTLPPADLSALWIRPARLGETT